MSGPTDVCGSMGADWHDSAMSGKVAERRERLGELAAAADAAAAAGGVAVSAATSSVLSTLTKLLHDSNLIVVGDALRCVVALLRGCGGDLSQSSAGRELLAPLLSLLREKKTAVLNPAHQALDLLWVHCLDMDAMLEALDVALADRLPKQRLEALLFVARCVDSAATGDATARTKLPHTAGKTLADAVFKMLGDSDSDVRTQALTTFAALVKLLGRARLTPLLQRLETSDPKKLQRLDAMVGQASGAATPTGASAASAAAEDKAESAPRPTTSSGSRSTKKSTLPPRPSTAAAPASAPAAAASASAAPTAAPVTARAPLKTGVVRKASTLRAGPSGSDSSSSSSSSAADTQAPVLSFEDSLAQLSAHAAVGGDICTLIQSKKWNEQVEGLQQLQSAIVALPPSDQRALMPAVFYFLAKTPSFKPFNVQVAKTTYELLPALAALLTPFPPSLLLLAFSDMFNKISDKKFAEGITEVLLSFCEAMPPRAVVAEWLAVGERDAKNLKSLEASLALLPRLIDEFGVAAFDVNVLIDAAKQAAAHVQKGIRDQAVPILMAIYAQTGGVLKELMCNNLKPATVTALEAEMAALGPVNPSSFVAKRVVRGQSAGAASKGLNLDEVIPRTDISPLVTEALLTKLGEDSWKLRKEGLEDVHAILAGANHRIGPKDGGLLEALKMRLLDNNKNLAKDALALLSILIADMGAPILKSASKLVPALLTALGDQKPFVKAEAVRALDAWLDLSGVQSVVKYLPKVLDVTSAGRKEALDILLARLPAGPSKAQDGVAKFDLSDIVTPVLGLCVDKQADVRAAAERVLEYVVASVGFDAVVETTKSLKKATVLQIMASLERYRHTTLASMQGGAGGAGAALSAPSPVNGDSGSFGFGGDDELVRPSTAPAKKKVVSSRPSVSTSGSMTSREPASASSAGPAADVVEKKPGMLKAGSRSRMSTLPMPKRAAAAAAAPAAVPDTVSESESGSADGVGTLLKKKDVGGKLKSARVLKDSRRVRGLFREFSKDEIEELDQHLYTLLADEHYAALFSNEFQRQVVALEVLSRELDRAVEGVFAVSDLLLKWCSWRMMDANTTLLATMLPFIAKMLAAFDRNGHKLTDGEAANILPTLIEKALGHNTARFRTDTRELINQSVSIYPVSKVFSYVAGGFESKNKRVQSECIEQVGAMLSRYGLQLCDAKKLVPQIGAMVGSADTGVRNAALNALSAVYAVAGDDLWTLLAKGPDKVNMQMIEERIKRNKTNGTRPPTQAGTAIPAPAASAAWADDAAAAPAQSSQYSAASTSAAAAVSAAPPSMIPAATGTPRKQSMMPVPAGSSLLLMRKKSGLGVSGSPPSSALKAKAQTMKPAQFAKLAADFAAMEAAAHEMNQHHHQQQQQHQHQQQQQQQQQHALEPLSPVHDDGESPPVSAQPKTMYTPVRSSPPQHQRYHSNVAEYGAALAHESADANLPGCFSLELDPLVAISPQPPAMAAFKDSALDTVSHSIPSRAAVTPAPAAMSIPSFSSPSAALTSPSHGSAGGVAQSTHLSDTLIVLSEPTVPVPERVEAMQHMGELIRKQGPAAIADNEEGVVYVLLTELQNSFVVYPATGLVKVDQLWNGSALNTIMQLVSHRSLMAAMPLQQSEQLLEALFHHLSDQRVLRSPACTELVSGCNQCILAALESLPRTHSFTLCIGLLRAAMLTPSRKGEVELIAKCVTKLVKALAREGAVGVDVAALLAALEAFTNDFSPADPTLDNAAIKAVLSVVHELVNVEGAGIVHAMTEVAPESTLAQYIAQMIGVDSIAEAVAQQAQPNAATGRVSAAPSPPPAQPRALDMSSSPKSSPSAASFVSPPASTRPRSGTDVSSGLDESLSAGSESPSVQSYREKIAALQSMGSMATASPLSTASPLPALPRSSPTGAAASSLPPPFPKAMSSIEQIRARFHAVKTHEQIAAANAQPASVSAPAPRSMLVPPSAVSVTPEVPATAAPVLVSAPAPSAAESGSSGSAPGGSSTLLALRARVAAMNKPK